MKFTVGWLKDYLDFDCSLIQLSHKLTNIGLEVENIRSAITDPDKFIVCEVIGVEKHPNADKLKICDVSDGKDNYKIVCGAQNVKNGLITVLAKEGAIIYNLKENEFKPMNIQIGPTDVMTASNMNKVLTDERVKKLTKKLNQIFRFVPKWLHLI